MKRIAVFMVILGATAGCGSWQCEKNDATLGSCRAEWVCGGDSYVAQCPQSKGVNDTALNPDCVCLKNGVKVATLPESSHDWCDGTDSAEKASTVNGNCGWNVPYY